MMNFWNTESIRKPFLEPESTSGKAQMEARTKENVIFDVDVVSGCNIKNIT